MKKIVFLLLSTILFYSCAKSQSSMIQQIISHNNAPSNLNFDLLHINPKDTLKAHFDVTNPNNLTLNSSYQVTQLNDLSGNGYNLTPTSTGPAYNYSGGAGNLPYVLFNGQNLKNSSFVVSQPYTAFFVVEQDTIVNEANILEWQTYTNGVAQYISSANSMNCLTLVSNSNWNPQMVPYFGQTGKYHVYMVVFNGVNSDIVRDNEPHFPSYWIGSGTVWSANPGTAATTKLMIGSDNYQTRFKFQELIIYTGVLSEYDQQQVWDYLMPKYGLLPNDYILWFGDSGTYGPVPPLSNAYTQTWVSLVSNAVGKDYMNYGKTGATLYSRTSYTGAVPYNFNYTINYLGAQNTGWIFSCFGTNDNIGTADTAAWTANYTGFIQKALIAGYSPSKVILCSPWYNYKDSTASKLVDTCISRISKNLGVQWADVYAYTKANGGESLIYSDSLHMIPKGDTVVATYLKQFIH